MPQARVSFVICVHNGGSSIARALDSVLTQPSAELEIVVVDDGSTDSTPEILRAYRGGIKMLRQNNRGLAAARNSGVAKAEGEYLAFLDADDSCLPGRLEKPAAALDRNPRAVLAFSDAVPVDARGRPLGATFVPADKARGPSMAEMLDGWWPILPSTVTMRRGAFEKCGGFSEQYRSAGGFEDTHLFMLAREQGPFVYVGEPLVRYRLSPLVDRLEKYAPGFRIFARHVRGRYGAAGDRLIRQNAAMWSRLLAARGVESMLCGDAKEARRALRCALRYQPIHRRNTMRLFRTYLPRAFAVAPRDRRRFAKADRAIAKGDLLNSW